MFGKEKNKKIPISKTGEIFRPIFQEKMKTKFFGQFLKRKQKKKIHSAKFFEEKNDKKCISDNFTKKRKHPLFPRKIDKDQFIRSTSEIIDLIDRGSI